MKTRILSGAASMAMWFVAIVAQAHSSSVAPATSAGLDIVLTIERTESTLPGGFPTMGAVRQSYGDDGTYTYEGHGGPNHLSGHGTYTYSRTGPNTASEDAVQYSELFTLPYHMEYTFLTSHSGTWKQHFAGGLIVFEGSFATSPSDSREQWAPDILAGATVILGSYDKHRQFLLATVTHRRTSYVERVIGTRRAKAGTYFATRMSARGLVTENTGADGLQVRSYTFTNSLGGYWKATSTGNGTTSEGVFFLLPEIPGGSAGD
jgi:hypothetical protein